MPAVTDKSVEFVDGTRLTRLGSKLHSFDDEPAWHKTTKPEMRIWYENGRRHRADAKPALIKANGETEWYFNGVAVVNEFLFGSRKNLLQTVGNAVFAVNGNLVPSLASAISSREQLCKLPLTEDIRTGKHLDIVAEMYRIVSESDDSLTGRILEPKHLLFSVDFHDNSKVLEWTLIKDYISISCARPGSDTAKCITVRICNGRTSTDGT
jgi:hypothetical protein